MEAMMGMVGEIGFVLAMVVVVIVAGKISEHTAIPEAALLTVVGLIYGFLPGPNLHLRPDLVLNVLLPPLLYHAALDSSLLAIRSRLRSVVSLSVLLVLGTALAIGGLLSAVVPVIPLAAAVAVGAAVAPPDPVAALAVGRRAGLPGKLSTLIEGEGLLNDATALTTYQVAVAVAVGGDFSYGQAMGEFALSAAGGGIVGAIVAMLVRLVHRWVDDPLSLNAVSLTTPFFAYTAAESAHGSGVLAVVVTGLIVGHQNPRWDNSASRLQTSAVWRLVNFVLEGFVFLLIGQQLPDVIAGLGAYSTGTVVATAGITVGVVLLLRPIWLLATQYVPPWLHARLGDVPDNAETEAEVDEAEPGTEEIEQADPDAHTEHRPRFAARLRRRRTRIAAEHRERRLTGRELVALSCAGTRGVITLAAAFAIPRTTAAGTPFPARDLLLFSAYLVVLVTLLGLGVTFGPLLRKLRLTINPIDQARLRNQARIASVEAGLARLDELIDRDNLSEQAVETMRRNLTNRRQRHRRRLAYLEDDPEALRSVSYEAAAQARREVLEAQREELLRWRDTGRLPDESLRILQRELDHEEHTLPMPTEH